MELKDTINFFFEVGILAKTPRSGFHFLGSGSQSVAEHINRVSYVGYALAMLDGTVDVGKVLKMCLFHDVSETRISDLNYVHQKYTERFEEKAHSDITKTLPFGDDMKALIDEYEERQTPESFIVKDADNIEWILALKEQIDIGNERAVEWIHIAIKRLHTDNAKKLAEVIMDTNSSEWWFDKEDSWFVDRDKSDSK